MKKKKITALMMAAAMAVVSVAGCSGNGNEAASSAGTTEAAKESQEEAEKEVSRAEAEKAEVEKSGSEKSGSETETRTVIVGTAGTGEPYSKVDDQGTWTGAEADLWAEVEARTGWTIEMKQVADMASLFGELNTGRVDVAANCFAITEARLKTYIASDPIYADAQVIIVQPDSEYKTLEDLRGCTIGVTAGQAAQTTVEGMAPEYDWEIVTYEDSNAGFQDCALGRIDCYANTVTNIEKAQKAQNLEFRMLDEKLFGNNVGWWFADTQEGAELRDEVNVILKEMKEDGTLSEIITKWFYEDLSQLISDEWLTATH